MKLLDNLTAGKGTHVWKFFRAGGFDQVKLQSGADIAALDQLDQKIWVTLSSPTKGLEFDTRTLDLIDTDKDGRIRVPEIIAAAKWICANLKNPDDLLKGQEDLPLAAINDTTEEGRRLLASARHILASLGKPQAQSISVDDTLDTVKIFAQTRFNGDGVIPPESAAEESLKAIILEIIGCMGGEKDRCGSPGITQTKIDQFFTELQAFSDWWKIAETAGAEILVLGEHTAMAFEAFKAVRQKIDDYFARCRLAAFDARAASILNRSEYEYVALAAKDLAASGCEFANFPLAWVEAGKSLALQDGLNPAWTSSMAVFRKVVIGPLLGETVKVLTESGWENIKTKMAPYETWLGAKAGAVVEKLGLKRVREILAGQAREALTKLIDQDKALEPEMNSIVTVERLTRYHRDLFQLLNNYVAFTDFYSRKRKSVFQVGTLYLDGRSCDLCVRVEDMNKHASLATLSKTYLAYCDCFRKATGDKMTIAAAFSGGDSENLMVGRNGVFYDRKGQDWDATITKIVEHPISIRQAIMAPYKRIGRMVGEQIEKIAAARDKDLTDKAATGLGEATKNLQTGKPAPPPPFDVARFAGIFAAIGLALGALGTALASVVSNFLKLAWWQMPLAIIGVFVAISGPSVVMAWLKLRQRNLGPILDANGWAINARVKINIPFGGALTSTAKLPPNSVRSFEDPYAEKNTARTGMIILLVAALFGGVAYWWYTHHHGDKSKSTKPETTNTISATPTNAAPAK